MEKPVSILIVDDDLGMLRTLKYILTEKGYDVVTHSNGKTAVETIKKRFFDIVLTDIKMPGMSGVDVLKEIKRYSPQTSVMMITAYTMHELVQEAKKGGAKAVFSKPLDLDQIIAYTDKFIKDKGTGTAHDAENPEPAEISQILGEREEEINRKNLLIEELKRELDDIKRNPTAMLDEARRKEQSKNLRAILKPKQYRLFTLLNQSEKNYDEIFAASHENRLDIRDIAALRLQISRLDKKLRNETVFRIERIRKNKILYLTIATPAEESP